MLWKIGGVKLIVSSLQGNTPIFLAKINSLNSSGTIIHHFGYGDNEITLQGKVVGDTKKNTLEALLKSGSITSVVGPTFSGNIVAENWTFRQDLVVCQGIDPTEPPESTVYSFSIVGIVQ